MLRSLQVAPRSLLWVNNLFLLFISLIPASAALLGGHPQSPASAVFYGLNVAAAGSSMMLFWLVAVRYHRRHGIDIDQPTVRRAFHRVVTGVLLALTGAAFAAVSPWLSYAIFWISPVSYVVVQLMPIKDADSAAQKL